MCEITHSLAYLAEQARAAQQEINALGAGPPDPCDALRAENRRLQPLIAALAFARSVIKSGEPWTPTCEEIIDSALRGARPE